MMEWQSYNSHKGRSSSTPHTKRSWRWKIPLWGTGKVDFPIWPGGQRNSHNPESNYSETRSQVSMFPLWCFWISWVFFFIFGNTPLITQNITKKTTWQQKIKNCTHRFGASTKETDLKVNLKEQNVEFLPTSSQFLQFKGGAFKSSYRRTCMTACWKHFACLTCATAGNTGCMQNHRGTGLATI